MSEVELMTPMSLGSIDDITAEVEGLLRAAYDQNG
jgi:hypothetical protein